ncbi:hypothetical protein [Bradyrhizobium diversitatis]|uniref:Uncharacterized protein n=1 Tax=Bradyrhizobium diversitatis TaxID=2755406 RepID=A0ABS0PF48_9BRAD|nr:hypothetical protein [Bradyrhizobium diversitatis]MBH5391866.1 hypothetical protein [Bradyrhizobium diversitatis]
MTLRDNQHQQNSYARQSSRRSSPRHRHAILIVALFAPTLPLYNHLRSFEPMNHGCRSAIGFFQQSARLNPVVRVHLESGERTLVLGNFAQRFIDLQNYTEQKLFDLIQSHVTTPENSVRLTRSQARLRLGQSCNPASHGQ